MTSPLVLIGGQHDGVRVNVQEDRALLQMPVQTEAMTRTPWLDIGDDVPTYLRSTDIFVLPSLSEGMSNAILEAMAHGVPCIATEIPGNTELVKHYETGILVQREDPAELARAIVELADDDALRDRLGRAGRAQVEEHYDLAKVAERYAGLYRSLTSPVVAEG